MMKHRSYYNLVKRYIDSWDSAGLISAGFPHNEYNFESKAVSSIITEDMNVEMIADIISEIFTDSFGAGYVFEETEQYIDIARSIYEEIHKTIEGEKS